MGEKLDARGSPSPDELYRLAYYDALTGLPNRHLFDDRIDRVIARAHRTGTPFCLLFIDLDRFKDVNDSLGHGVGDRLLSEVGRRLRETVRESDTIARLGGDEFMVILETASHSGAAAAVARKILAALATPVAAGERRLPVSASIGIACFPDDGRSAEELIRNADAAMYRAKQEGRERYCFYTPAPREGCAAPDRLALVWQPRVRLANGALAAIAASVRSRHAGAAAADASRWIARAERGGTGVDIDRRALEDAARAAAAWRQSASARAPRIALDVSTARMGHPGACDEILATLRRHGLQPDRLELGLPENALPHPDAPAIHFVRTLGACGVRFAAEDIGTGHASAGRLGRLGRLPIDRMKIDARFVQDLTTSETDCRIVAALIALAHAQGRRVVALGVETETQRRFLEKLGCDEAQGGLFGPPVDFDTLMRRWTAHARALPARHERPRVREELRH